METIVTGTLPYQLTSKTFKVVDKEMWTTTNTSVSVRQVYTGIGWTNSANVNVDTIKHDRLYLMDDQGNLHDVELTNWNLGIAKDHRITIVWPAGANPDEKPKPTCGMWITVKENHSMGSVLAIKNHSTNRSLFNEKLMRAMTRNPAIIVIPLVALVGYFVLRQWVIEDAGWGYILFTALIGILLWMKTWNPMKYNSLQAMIKQLLG